VEPSVQRERSMEQREQRRPASLPEPAAYIVEDEPITRTQLTAVFESDGYRVQAFADGERLLACFEAREPELLLLDISLPGRSGLELAREFRARSDCGIILVTAKQEQIDRIVGLECGADDYVTKPFDPRELLSRARNLVRRVVAQRTHQQRGRTCRFNGWTLDLRARQLTDPRGQPVALSAAEFQLLVTLIEHAGQVLDRNQLMNEIRNRPWYPDDRYIDVLVGQVRRKLGESAGSARCIATVHGIGYLFAAELE
jgi:DNA-binding response OmpR family regulator